MSEEIKPEATEVTELPENEQTVTVNSAEPEATPVVPVAKPATKKAEKPKFAEPIPVDLNAYRESLPKPAGDAVVGTGVTDEVRLDAIVFKNLYARRSLSVHHLQRRLAELGYTQAQQDRDGYFGDNTLKAITEFQSTNGLTNTGSLDKDTFLTIFAGDPNVTPIV